MVVVEVALLVLGYFVLSVGLGFFNRWALGSRWRGGAGFSYPFFYSCCHMVASVMLTSAISFTTSRALKRHSIYTRELAERGELLTHDKDKSVLTLMNVKEELEESTGTAQTHHNHNAGKST